MIKYLFALIFLMIFLSIQCQDIKYRGLEFNNLYMINPAFIEAEKNLQFDIIGYSQRMSSSDKSNGLFCNFIGSIDKINSSFRAGFERRNFLSLKDRYNYFGYSYSTALSDKASLSFGISGNLNKYEYTIDFLDQIDDTPIVREIKYHKGWTDFGVGMLYQNLTVGINTKFLFKNDYIKVYETLADTTENLTTGIYSTNIYIDYKFSAGKYNFKPQLLWRNYNKDLYGYIDKYSLGFIADYNDRCGLGFSVGRSFTIYGFVKIIDAISLQLSLFETTHLGLSNSDTRTIMGQIRINI